jgi:hypothetical protein
MRPRYNAGMIHRSLVMVVVAFALAAFAQNPAPSNPVTETSADLGPCSADFHVTNMAGKPLYNAKISTVIRYGFLGKRKLEIEMGTNSDGRARITKLPAEAKKPIEFTITNGTDKASRSYEPATDCHARYDIPLGKKE